MILLDSLQPSPSIYYGNELVFFEEDHRYEYEGKYVPGVTTMLKILDKPALMPWAAKMCSEHIKANYQTGMKPEEFEALCDAGKAAHRVIKEDAADIGKLVHKYADDVLTGKTPTKHNDPIVLKGIAAFEAWIKEHEIEPIASERRIFSLAHWFAGTTDKYGFVDGNRSILDWKTSSGIWPEYWYQLSAYELAIREELQIDEPMDRWIIRLDKQTGDFEAKKQAFNPLHTRAFLQIRELNRTLTAIAMAKKDASAAAKAEKAAAKEADKAAAKVAKVAKAKKAA